MWNAKDVCEEMIDDDGPPPPIPVDDPVEGEGEIDAVVVDGEEGAEAVEGEGEGEEGPADESEPVQVTILLK